MPSFLAHMQSRFATVFGGQTPAARRHLFLGAMLPALVLLATPVQAINFSFPGNLPTGCSGANGSYTCGSVALAAGDTLSVAVPSNIAIQGSLSSGANAQFNAGGSASDLTFTVDGTIDTGASTIVNATLNSGAAMNFGAYNTLGGNLTSVTGAITTGANSAVTGSIFVSKTGAITIGANNTIDGNLNTVTGAINVGAGTTVNGYIASSTTGAVTLGATNYVSGTVTTSTGAVNVGAGSTVVGAITSNVVGAITIGASVTVDSTLTTHSGAITIGAACTITDLVSTVGAGAITMGAQSIIDSVCCDPTVNADCVNNNTTLPMPPVCVIKASAFECLETTTNIPWNPAARKPLYTKLVSTNFTFDIAALKSDGTLQPNYAGTGARVRYVKVELHPDTPAPMSCTALANQPIVASQTVSFNSAVVSGTPGRTLSGNFNVPNAAPILRALVRECTDSTCTSFTSLAPSCSSDRFAVRPTGFALSTSASAAAPSSSALPTIAAGKNFTLYATTNPVSGYTGTLVLDTSKLTAQSPLQDQTQQSGGAVGGLTPSSFTANTGAAIGTYTEAGYLYLAPGAYRDDAFTSVDSANGDCIPTTAGDNSLADTLIGGKYGCSIGNKSAVTVGRFIPDHFTITPASLNASCMATSTPFTYFGQDGFTTTFILTAQSLTNTTTTNYAGPFAKLNLGSYPSYGFTAAVLPTGSSLASSATAPSGIWSLGVANVSARHQISRSPQPAPETSIVISAAPSDGEVPAIAASPAGAATKLRYGRIKMQNTYGSELLPLPVPLEAQYWTGSYYVTNTADSCSVIPTSSITMGNYLKQLHACNTQLSPVGSNTLVAGRMSGAGLSLSKPGANNTGSVDLTINLSAIASGNTCTSPVQSTAIGGNLPWFGTTAPVSRATFGVYKSAIMYQREMY